MSKRVSIILMPWAILAVGAVGRASDVDAHALLIGV